MSCSLPTDFVALAMVANHYTVIRVRQEKRYFITEQLDKELAVVEAAARAFAHANQIPYHPSLLNIPPIVTVMRYGTEWFPVGLHPTKIRKITKIMTYKNSTPQTEHLGGTRREALTKAQWLAASSGSVCIPLFGIYLESLNS